MIEFIKLFANKGLSSRKKIGLAVCIVLAIFLIDRFTHYPSVSMIKEKYEAIEQINKVLNDPATDSKTKKIAREDLAEVLGRRTIGHSLSTYADNASYTVQQISGLFPRSSPIKNFFSWVWFLLLSNFFFIIGFVSSRDDIKTLQKTQRYLLMLAALGAILINTIICFVVVSVLSPEKPFVTGALTHFLLGITIGTTLTLIEMRLNAKKAAKAAILVPENPSPSSP